jgi:hypothetical protein
VRRKRRSKGAEDVELDALLSVSQELSNVDRLNAYSGSDSDGTHGPRYCATTVLEHYSTLLYHYCNPMVTLRISRALQLLSASGGPI